MNETDNLIELTKRFGSIRERAKLYFENASAVFERTSNPKSARIRSYEVPINFWETLPEKNKIEAENLKIDIGVLARVLGPELQRSPLLTEADQREAGFAFKGMLASLRFRRFRHWDVEVLHDEGRVLGVAPSGQSEEDLLAPVEAYTEFERWVESLDSRLELITSGERIGEKGPPISAISSRPIAAGYRPGTAFIMMWMAKDKPELEDVSKTIKRCFEAFGINAVRADDIEHEDVITARILDEIKTSEFLFADLTGERPSVYYEVGYAHAIGRRVIMYRKKGTRIHFDLAAYNCPEYANLTELEEKLQRRLVEVTGKRPSKP